MSNKVGCLITGRNDDYGGNLVLRAAYVINSALETYDEVVFVDWNSEGKTLIEETESNLLRTGKLRCIVVNPTQHKKHMGDFYRPQLSSDVAGRNVAIVRMTSDYIISTNIDDIQPPRKDIDPLLHDLSSKKLLITAARYGLQSGLDEIRSISHPKNVSGFRNYLLSRKYPQAWELKMSPDDAWSKIGWPGDFQIAHRDLWFEIRGFDEWMKGMSYADTMVQRKVIELGYEVKASFNVHYWHIDHSKEQNVEIKPRQNDTICLHRDFVIPRNDDNWGLMDYELREFSL